MKQTEKEYLRSVFTKEYKDYLLVHRPVISDSRLSISHISRMAMLLDVMNGLGVEYSDIVEKEGF